MLVSEMFRLVAPSLENSVCKMSLQLVENCLINQRKSFITVIPSTQKTFLKHL